jgi:hypothetical protein
VSVKRNTGNLTAKSAKSHDSLIAVLNILFVDFAWDFRRYLMTLEKKH